MANYRVSQFLADRDWRPGILANWQGSVMVLQSFQDGAAVMHNVEPFAQRLIDSGFPVKRVYYNGFHNDHPDSGPSARIGTIGAVTPPTTIRWDWAEILLHWFDHELKGIATDIGPPVQITDSDGVWRSEREWPPADAAPLTFYLGGDGALVGDASQATAGLLPVGPDPVTMVPYDPADDAGASCPACVVLRTEPLTDDLRFAGLPTLPITVTPAGPRGVVTARLYAESADGSRLLTWAQMDLRFAAGGEQGTLVVTPGSSLVAHMEFEPVDAIVHEGDRLRLVLAQGWAGRSDDPLPGLGKYQAAPSPPVLLETGGDKSRLIVQAFTRAPDELIDFPW